MIMRAVTKSKKKRIMKQILKSWLKIPELRLGQIIYIAIKDKDLFNIEDYVLMNKIKDYVKKITYRPKFFNKEK